MSDFTTNFCFSKGVSWEVPKQNEAIIPAILDRVWKEDNDEPTLLWELGQNGSVTGDTFCVPPDSEALTPEGWKNLYELQARPDLPIATLNPDTEAMEWQAASLNVFRYQGNLVHHRSTCMDHLATPDHDLWVRMNTSRLWRKVHAEDVKHNGWRVRTAAEVWDGAYAPVTVPGSTESSSAASRCPEYTFTDPMDLAEFVGWYVSEGSLSGGRRAIQFAQSAVNETHRQAIAALIRRMGFRPTVSSEKIDLCYAPLARWAEDTFGHGAKNKHLPAWVKAWPRPMLLRLLETLLKGDGTRPDPRGGRNNSHVYRTTSDRLVDDLQEVAAKVGWSSSAKERVFTPYRCTNGKVYEGSSRAINFVTYAERGTPASYNLVPYDGEVWCPTVPNGLWFHRRGGQVVVTGNCKIAYEDAWTDPAGNYHRGRVRILPLNPSFCVTPDTLIRTRRGLLSHREVRVGDETWAWDPLSETWGWASVERVNRYTYSGPLYRFRHEHLDALSTPDHRWVTESGFLTSAEVAVTPCLLRLGNGELISSKELHIDIEDYEGLVWCPTTSTGTWTAWRGEVMPENDVSASWEEGSSGRQICFLTGNCFP